VLRRAVDQAKLGQDEKTGRRCADWTTSAARLRMSGRRPQRAPSLSLPAIVDDPAAGVPRPGTDEPASDSDSRDGSRQLRSPLASASNHNSRHVNSFQAASPRTDSSPTSLAANSRGRHSHRIDFVHWASCPPRPVPPACAPAGFDHAARTSPPAASVRICGPAQGPHLAFRT